MGSTVMAVMMFSIAFLLFFDGYYIGPILQRLGITHIARISVSVFFTAMGTYMAWIGYLFARDLLHESNYSWQIVIMRIGVLVGLIGLTGQVLRNRSR